MGTTMTGKAMVTAALALGACAPPPPNPHGLERGEAMITVGGVGKVVAKSDEARLSVGVTSVGANAAEASAANATRMTAVIAALKAQGIADADIKTSDLSVEHQDWGPHKGKFEATNNVQVVVRDVSKAGPAVKAATNAGANVVSGPDMHLADPDAANRNAAALAFKSARARADAYAAAAGMKVVRVLAIHDGAAAQASPEMTTVDAAEYNVAPPPPVMAGTETSEAVVSVDFALAPK